MPLTVTDSLEARLAANPIIVASRQSGLLNAVIDKGHDDNFKHVVVKYSLADATVVLANLVQGPNKQSEMEALGARQFADTYLAELTGIFCRTVGCQDDPRDLANYISDLNNWTSLWFLNAFGEVAREVCGLGPSEFYHNQGPPLMLSNKQYTQAGLFGKVFGAKALFSQIQKSSRNLTSISDFNVEELSKEEAASVRKRIEFPGKLSGGLLRIVRTRHDKILEQSQKVYGENLQLAIQNDALRTEGVLLYGASALGDFGHVVKDPNTSELGKAVFYAAFPSLQEKILLGAQRPLGMIRYGLDQVILRVNGYSLYQQQTLELEIEKDKAAREAAEVTRLRGERELQIAELSIARANTAAAIAQGAQNVAEQQAEFEKQGKEKALADLDSSRRVTETLLTVISDIVQAAGETDIHGEINKYRNLRGYIEKFSFGAYSAFCGAVYSPNVKKIALSLLVDGGNVSVATLDDFVDSVKGIAENRSFLETTFVRTKTVQSEFGDFAETLESELGWELDDPDFFASSIDTYCSKLEIVDPALLTDEKMLPEAKIVAQFRLNYHAIRDEFSIIDGFLPEEKGFLEAVESQLLAGGIITRFLSAIEEQSQGRKGIYFGQCDLETTLNDSAMEAKKLKGEFEYSTQVETGLDVAGHSLDTIGYIAQNVLRDVLLNSVQHGANKISAYIGRAEFIDELDSCDVLPDDVKESLLGRGCEVYIKISDDGSGIKDREGNISLDKAREMTKYFLNKEKDATVNLSTRIGEKKQSGLGSRTLGMYLDLHDSYAIYQPRENGTDVYIVFTKKTII